MMPQQRLELLGGAVQVVGRQHPDGDVRDAGLAAPVQQVRDVPGADDVALADVVETGRARPAPVAVDHDRDVLRDRQALQVRAQPSLVHRIDGRAHPHTTEPIAGIDLATVSGHAHFTARIEATYAAVASVG